MSMTEDGAVEVELRERPTMRVEVGGESFEARLGDLSYLPHAIEALARFREVAAAAGDPEAALAAVGAFSGAASRMCESLLGEGSWRRIVPEGRDRGANVFQPPQSVPKRDGHCPLRAVAVGLLK